MKKGAFCDSVLRPLASWEYSRSEMRFQRRDVAEYLNDGIGSVIQSNFYELYSAGEFGNIDPGFLTTFESVPVLFSTTRNQWYSTLPNLPIALPRGLGLFEVSPMQDQSSAYIPLQSGSASLYKGLESAELFGEVGYKQEGRIIWYKNLNFPQPTVTEVLINICCDTTTLSMDDELPIPSNYVSQVREYVFKVMTGGLQIPTDKMINANPDNR